MTSIQGLRNRFIHNDQNVSSEKGSRKHYLLEVAANKIIGLGTSLDINRETKRQCDTERQTNRLQQKDRVQKSGEDPIRIKITLFVL